MLIFETAAVEGQWRRRRLPDKAEPRRDRGRKREKWGGGGSAGFLSVPQHGPAVLWGLISMPQKVTAGNLLNTTAICLPCSKGTNEKVEKLKSTWNFKDNTF